MLLVGTLWLGIVATARACGNTGLERLGVGMPATQNSQYQAAVAGLAVDGNTNQNFLAGSCSHTQTTPVPMFWVVDLQTICTIERIKIYNRLDCCSEWLTDFRVYVGLTEQTYTEALYHPGTAGSVVELDLFGISGRFLKIEKSSYGNLGLCEVEIYGYGTHCPRQYRKVPGNVGTGAVLQSTTVSSSTQCAAICSSLPACRGYNLQLDGAVRVCHVLDTAQYATGNGDATFFLRE